jgi:D-glycero-D-manno-heptose 1,7-bisphosphate phosphatase
MPSTIHIDSTWTLFLDRDGVINERIFDGYVLDWKDFHFCEGNLEALSKFSKLFQRIVVVTNQQCVSKGLISEDNLSVIHDKMCGVVSQSGGRIDAVFAAKESKNCAPFHRKPHPEMAVMAKNCFPEIDFQKSIMVGDTDTDILFGKNLGMKTALVVSKEKTNVEPDIYLKDLCDLLHYLS